MKVLSFVEGFSFVTKLAKVMHLGLTGTKQLCSPIICYSATAYWIEARFRDRVRVFGARVSGKQHSYHLSTMPRSIV